MLEPTIRPYRPSDSAGIARLIADYRAEQSGPVVDQEAVAATLARFLSSTQDRILVAELKGNVTGYVAFHLLPLPLIQGTEAYVSDLLVAGTMRGGGIGSRLLRAVEDEARAHGCVRLMLNNHKTELSYTRGFYGKHTFRERVDFANFVKPLR
ncbi:MAG: GNAT family N-acetyltransferase [Lentisphaerae bacterium]|nr:GNAT family N-acetyltransferase [Lentisphaerota bacterium]